MEISLVVFNYAVHWIVAEGVDRCSISKLSDFFPASNGLYFSLSNHIYSFIIQSSIIFETSASFKVFSARSTFSSVLDRNYHIFPSIISHGRVGHIDLNMQLICLY